MDTSPIKLVCSNCGRDRTVPSSAADPGPCPCGCSTRVTEALLGVVSPLPPPRSPGGAGVRSTRPDLPPAA